jgi:hypothetical protein
MRNEIKGKTASVQYPGARRGVLQWLIVALVFTTFHGTALAGWTELESGGKWFTVNRIWIDHNPAIMKISINGAVGNCAQNFWLDKDWPADGFPDEQYKAMYSVLLTSMTVGVELNILYNLKQTPQGPRCYINQLEIRRVGGDLPFK